MIEEQGRQLDVLRRAARETAAPVQSSRAPLSSERSTRGTIDPADLFVRAQSSSSSTQPFDMAPAPLSLAPIDPASPPDDLVYDLIRLYFVRIHPWAPILLDSPDLYARPWSITVLAIIVITVRISDDHRLRGIQEQVRDAARRSVIIEAVDSTTLASVQGLALLALDLIGSGQGPDGWGIMGLLCRSAVHMGLCVEEDAEVPATYTNTAPAPSLRRTRVLGLAKSWQEDESRRRLFWLIFCIDRFTCVTTGWEFGLPNYDIKRRLPSSDADWNGHVSRLLLGEVLRS